MMEKNARNEIVYLVGLPCSGKSTYIREHYTNHAVISNDAIVEEYASARGIDYGTAWSALDYKAVAAECRRRFNKAVREGRPVVIDNTNMTVSSRRLYEAAGSPSILFLRRKRNDKKAVIFEIDEAERLRRTEKRAAETGKRVPEDAIRRMKSLYVAPAAAEGFVSIVSANKEKSDRNLRTNLLAQRLRKGR